MADSEKALKTGGLSHRVRAAGQRLNVLRAAQKTESDPCDRLALLSQLCLIAFPLNVLVRLVRLARMLMD
jgi:hypothetical protein